jgi:hypothetical protein
MGDKMNNKITNNFYKLKQICENDDDDANGEIKAYTCALVKEIEKDYFQNSCKDNMFFFKMTIFGGNYMGGGKADKLWKNEQKLINAWNMDIVSHSVHNNRAGYDECNFDYGGGRGVAWESDTHTFVFKLPNDFFIF